MADKLSDHDLEDLGRTRYHSTGRVDWPRIMALFPVGILAAMAIAGALIMLHEWGLYFVVIIPGLAAVGTMGLMHKLVEYGHCRNKIVATLIAIVIGSIAYLGYYQGQLIREVGWEAAYRIDLLPEIIWMNWKTQVLVGKRGQAAPPDDISFFVNILLFFVEVGLVLGGAIFGGREAAGRVYSEDDEYWSKSVAKNVPEWWGPKIEDAIRTNTLADVLERVEVQPIPDPQSPPPRTIITVEYFADGASPPVYLTATHVPKGTSVIVSQLLLTPDEIEACRPLFLPHVAAVDS